MPVKVKRGLGLLVVALLCFVLMTVTVVVAGGTDPGMAAGIVVLLAVIGCVGCALVGLVMIAWGLLAD